MTDQDPFAVRLFVVSVQLNLVPQKPPRISGCGLAFKFVLQFLKSEKSDTLKKEKLQVSSSPMIIPLIYTRISFEFLPFHETLPFGSVSSNDIVAHMLL